MDDATLHAYVDGQLPPERAAQVADWLLTHPAHARRVLDWRAQRDALRNLHLDWLDEPLPRQLLAAAAPPDRRRRAPALPLAWAATVVLALGLGAAGGWTAHAGWPGNSAHGIPAFARDAAIAHVLYQPERRHPVEVAASEQDHLVQWLSRRLGQPLRVPPLDDEGYHLVGGRLLPAGGEESPDAGEDRSGAPLPQLARAQFMYEDAQGQRLTLYISTGATAPQAPAAFRLAQRRDPASGQLTRSLYWIEGPLGYALSGPLDEARLRQLALQVHQRLRKP